MAMDDLKQMTIALWKGSDGVVGLHDLAFDIFSAEEIQSIENDTQPPTGGSSGKEKLAKVLV